MSSIPILQFSGYHMVFRLRSQHYKKQLHTYSKNAIIEISKGCFIKKNQTELKKNIYLYYIGIILLIDFL